MELEADCRDYIEDLSDLVEMGGALVMSNWDNRRGKGADFECAG